MNKNLHRLVFSRVRGELMVVQETASSVAGGAVGSRTPQTSSIAMMLRHVAWAAICTLGLSVLVPVACAQAAPASTAALPLVASPSAPTGQRPIIDAAGNGVPVMHIAPPTAGGVSRNQLQQFNVDRNGLILNNSPTNGQSQLGGWIAGNPQLGHVPARVIVNEVVGTSSSLLKGTIEVAGRKADVVISNPNGLFCDGCNFLNTARATLSTGTPRYDAQGGLKSFDVQQGQITVGSGGLNAVKRYGDGFAEQQLVNDQVLALTGRRYLSGYQSTEDEFKALMDAGVVYAKRHQLTPGLALTAEQMALLTTDIVWLTTRTVTLTDGSTTRVLVPQVYLRRPQSQDLSVTGALMAGSDVVIRAPKDLANSGTIQGERVTLLSDDELVNQGTVRGADVYARASNDLKNPGGRFIGAGANSTIGLVAGRDIVLQTTTLVSTNATQASDATSTRTNIDRVATIQGGTVSLSAARDLLAQGASVAASGDLIATAGRDIKASSVEGRYQISTATDERRGRQGDRPAPQSPRGRERRARHGQRRHCDTGGRSQWRRKRRREREHHLPAQPQPKRQPADRQPRGGFARGRRPQPEHPRRRSGSREWRHCHWQPAQRSQRCEPQGRRPGRSEGSAERDHAEGVQLQQLRRGRRGFELRRRQGRLRRGLHRQRRVVVVHLR